MVQLERILKKLALIFFRALTSTLWTHCFQPRLSRILNVVARVEAILRGPALIIFGALASIIPTLYFQRLLSTTWLAVTALLASFFALWGMGVVSLISTLQRKIREGIQIEIYWPLGMRTQRKIILRAPRVGILSDIEWEEQHHVTHTYTNVTPKEWIEAIKNKADQEHLKLKVREISANTNFDQYLIVLNPYGGVYPEADLKDLTTLNRIFAYVENGGTFVNVADVPGFWAYSPLLRRKVHATPPVYAVDRIDNKGIRVIGVRSFQNTPFGVRLGLWVEGKEPPWCWNIEFEEPYKFVDKGKLKMLIDRAVVEKHGGEVTVETIVKTTSEVVNGSNLPLTPLFFANYGQGRFLISLICQSESQNRKMKEILVGLVNSLVKTALAD